MMIKTFIAMAGWSLLCGLEPTAQPYTSSEKLNTGTVYDLTLL